MSELWTTPRIAAASFTTLTLLAWVYMMLNRNWPPLKTKSVPALGIMILSCYAYGLSAMMFVADPPLTTWCEVAGSLYVIGSLTVLGAVFLRVYRFYNILIKHNAKLTPFWKQLVLFTSVFLVFYNGPVWLAMLLVDYRIQVVGPGETCAGVTYGAFYEFDLSASSAAWVPVLDFYLSIRVILLVSGLLGVIGGLFYMTWKLRHVRSQFNEWRSSLFAIGVVMLAVIVDQLLLWDLMILSGLLAGCLMFWAWSWAPFYYLVTNNEEYLFKYTYGFRTMPTPQEVKARLDISLANPEVAKQFREFANRRHAIENLDFYEMVVELDETIGWFERQARVLSIMERFIQDGCPDPINISGRLRKEILEGNLNDYLLFEKAKIHILHIMENDLADEFRDTEGMKNLETAAQNEADEFAAVAAGGLLATGAEQSPAAKRSGSSVASKVKPPGIANAPLPPRPPASEAVTDDAPPVPDTPSGASLPGAADEE